MDTVPCLQLPCALTGGVDANPEENEYGSGHISAPAAAEGAGSSKDGFPHTPQPEAEYGSGYGLDPGASGVSARFPHTQTPSNDQLETGGGPAKTDTPESVEGTLKFSQLSPVVSLLGAHLSDNFPWLRYVPDRLRHRLSPTLVPGDFAPGPVLILLYAGRDDPLSLDSCIYAHYPRLSPHIVAFDTLRPPQALGQDLLADQPYGYLCQAAIDGRVRLVCGGPYVVHFEMVPQTQCTASCPGTFRSIGLGPGSATAIRAMECGQWCSA